jgi:hypothetical protein
MLLWTLASFLVKFQHPLVLLLLLVLYVLIDVETTQPLSHLKIPKTKYVQLVIDWCHAHLKLSNTIKPSVVLKYHPNKQYKGYYNPVAHEVVIYVNEHTSIQALTNTVIHEYIHARQKSRSFNQQYAQYTQEKGYWLNPYEIEARTLSKQHEQACLKALSAYVKGA